MIDLKKINDLLSKKVNISFIPKEAEKKGLLLINKNRICIFCDKEKVSFKFFIGPISNNRTTGQDISLKKFPIEILYEQKTVQEIERFLFGNNTLNKKFFLEYIS